MSWQACRGMGQMCETVITVIAPFSSSTLGEMAGQHHLDAHTSTSTALTSRGKVSGVVSLQQEGRSEIIITCVFVCVCVCVPVECVHLPSLSPSRFPALSLVTFFLSFGALQSLSSFLFYLSASPESSPAASEIHESVFLTQKLQNV